MSLDPFRKVISRDPFEESALGWNAKVDAARDFRASQFAGGIGVTVPRRFGEKLLVQNDSGTDVDRFGILGIDVGGAVFDPSTDPETFQETPAVIGVAPATASHVGRFVVALEPIPDGKYGICQMVGIVAVQVDLTDVSHRFADVKDATFTELQSAEAGAAQIIVIDDSGTGVKWALVNLVGAEAAAEPYFPLARQVTESGTPDYTMPGASTGDIAATGLRIVIGAAGGIGDSATSPGNDPASLETDAHDHSNVNNSNDAINIDVPIGAFGGDGSWAGTILEAWLDNRKAATEVSALADGSDNHFSEAEISIVLGAVGSPGGNSTVLVENKDGETLCNFTIPGGSVDPEPQSSVTATNVDGVIAWRSSDGAPPGRGHGPTTWESLGDVVALDGDGGIGGFPGGYPIRDGQWWDFAGASMNSFTPVPLKNHFSQGAGGDGLFTAEQEAEPGGCWLFHNGKDV